jgi:DNA-binding NarL/FixJ family response regulator
MKAQDEMNESIALKRLRCCLIAQPGPKTRFLSALLVGLGAELVLVAERVRVGELARLRLDLLLIDADQFELDPLETLRMTRFVLPNCVIALHTDVAGLKWPFECHLAGANCVLLKGTTAVDITAGIRRTLRTGCFTDPGFADRHAS